MNKWHITGIVAVGVALTTILILEVIGTLFPPGRADLKSIMEALSKIGAPQTTSTGPALTPTAATPATTAAAPAEDGLLVSVEPQAVEPTHEPSRGWSVIKSEIDPSDPNAGGVDLRYTCTLPAVEGWFPQGALTGVMPDAAGIVWLDAGRVYRIRAPKAAQGIRLMFYEPTSNAFLRGDTVHSAKQLNSEEGILVTYDKKATVLVLRWASAPCKAANILVERLSETDGNRALAALPESRKRRFR